MKRILTGLALSAALVAPQAALACGGLFCDTSQPVNQSAERIVFAQDGDTVHMHVQIAYQGPPTEFGWLLPAAADVEVGLSSEQLFTTLDNSFGPRFTLQTEFEDGCDQLRFAGGPAADGAGGVPEQAPGDPNGGVQVLSREAIGAFDVATLLVDSVDDLRGWLDENEYQIPEQTDALLTPYVEMGAAFVAVKLLPLRDSGDISPLRLSFTSPRPAIPIVPTAVAAEPDMGIIVHVLAEHRAIPFNYRHVVINEAAIDWQSGGANYDQVVSQAADEADGRAFATDYAGAAGAPPAPYGPETRAAVAAAETWQDLWGTLNLWDAGFIPVDADLMRVLPAGIILPDDIELTQFINCPNCFDDRADEIEIDGAALAAIIEAEVDAPREELAELFAANPYLTRLYSTMSAAEMTVDPEFATNPDLGDVPSRRTAIQRVKCVNDSPDFANAVIETPSGIRFQLVDGQNPNIIRRQEGETVRGMDVPGAQVIERTMEAGPNEVIADRTQDIVNMNPIALATEGCMCDAGRSSGPLPWAALGVFLLFGRRRRRRRR